MVADHLLVETGGRSASVQPPHGLPCPFAGMLRIQPTRRARNSAGFGSEAAAKGAANREALRQYFHGAVLAFGAILQEEIQAKLHPDCVLTFGRLGAADVQGRARAFGSMTAQDDNIPGDEAAVIAGLR